MTELKCIVSSKAPTCCVIMPEEFKDHALIHNPDALIEKYVCGRPAEYKVGMWNMCEKHKKYLADPKKWEATPLDKETIK